MLDVSAGAWFATLGRVFVLLALDWAISTAAACSWIPRGSRGSVFYIAIAVLFGVALGVLAGWRFGAEYFAGYIVETSLSVDNLFVFGVIMTTFAVPADHQQKVLTIGIVLALVLRGIFIALGAAAVGHAGAGGRVRESSLDLRASDPLSHGERRRMQHSSKRSHTGCARHG